MVSLIVRDHVDFMLFLYHLEHTDERSWVTNPGDWLFILRLVPDQEITVKPSMKHLLSWKWTDFEWLCWKGKCNYEKQQQQKNQQPNVHPFCFSMDTWAVGNRKDNWVNATGSGLCIHTPSQDLCMVIKRFGRFYSD